MTRTDRETVHNIRKRPDVFLSSDVDGELIIVHGQTGGFFALKQVGYQIWRALDDESDLARICEQLCEEYSVSPEECSSSVALFAQQLVDAGFAEYA